MPNFAKPTSSAIRRTQTARKYKIPDIIPMARHLIETIGDVQLPILPVLSGECGPHNQLIVAYGNLFARFSMAEKISEGRKLHNTTVMITAILEVAGRLMIQDEKTEADVRVAQNEFDQLLQRKHLPLDKLIRVLETYKKRMEPLAPTAIIALTGDEKYLFWESNGDKTSARQASVEFRRARLHLVPKAAFTAASQPTYTHLTDDDGDVTLDQINNLSIETDTWAQMWVSASPNARIGMLEAVVAGDPTSAMRQFIVAMFCLCTVLCKGSNYTDQWVEKVRSRLSDSSHVPIPASLDASMLRTIAASLSRDSLEPRVIRRTLQVMYLAAKEPIFRPIAWVIEQARMSNITTALALAECFAKVKFFPIDILETLGVPQEQFLSFAKVAIMLLQDPFGSIVAAGDAVRAYADIGYVADILKGDLLSDNPFRTGYKGDLTKSVVLPITTLKQIADVISAVNQQTVTDFFSIEQVLSARLGIKTQSIRNKLYMKVATAGAEQHGEVEFEKAGVVYHISDAEVVKGETLPGSGLVEDQNYIIITPNHIIKLTEQSTPAHIKNVAIIAKALHKASEQTKLRDTAPDEGLNPTWNEDLSPEVMAAARALNIQVDPPADDSTPLGPEAGEWGYLAFHIPGRVAADSNIAAKQVWPWGYPPTQPGTASDDTPPRPKDRYPTEIASVQPGTATGGAEGPTGTGSQDTQELKTVTSVFGVSVRANKDTSKVTMTGKPTKLLDAENLYQLMEPLYVNMMDRKLSIQRVSSILSKILVEPGTEVTLRTNVNLSAPIPTKYHIYMTTEESRLTSWRAAKSIDSSWMTSPPGVFIMQFNPNEEFYWRPTPVPIRDDADIDQLPLGHALLTLPEYHSRLTILQSATGKAFRRYFLSLHFNTIGRLPDYLYQAYGSKKPTNKSSLITWKAAAVFSSVFDSDPRFWLWLENSIIDAIMEPVDLEDELTRIAATSVLPSLLKTFEASVKTTPMDLVPANHPLP